MLILALGGVQDRHSAGFLPRKTFRAKFAVGGSISSFNDKGRYHKSGVIAEQVIRLSTPIYPATSRTTGRRWPGTDLESV
jgi:hypothetical protein